MFKIFEKLNSFPLSWIKNLTAKHPDAEIYLVGGAVRDFLIGRETKDLDFVVRGVEAKKLEKFLSENGEVDFVGKSFGVYKFRPNLIPAPQSSAERLRRSDGKPSPNPSAGGGNDEPSPNPIRGRGLKSPQPPFAKGGNIEETPLVEFDIALPRTEHSFNVGVYKDFDIKSDHKLEIEKDLERRDFTINAIALKLKIKNSKLDCDIVDPFGGQKDLENKIIRTVGNAEERFNEDATRMARAIRLACQLDFELDDDVAATIKKKNNLIKKIATERIGEELNKIIMTKKAEDGFRLMQELGILNIIMPELCDCIGVEQSRNHVYTVYEHSLRALGFAAKANYPIEVRWAALLHDTGKPQTRRNQNNIFTFFNHEKISAGIAKKILRRFRYNEKLIQKISHLIYHHMFYYNIGEITDSAVRRFVRKACPENVENLINLRIADRLGMGRPKAKPFKLIELERRIKEVSLDPISVKMLKINGDDIMKELKMKPGHKIGFILNALLNEVLEDPAKNDREYLLGKIKELNKLNDEDLKKLAPDLEEYEEKRREKLIGKQFVFKGKRLERRVRRLGR
ncbi:MAG: HD domain-containing protein [bacterium]